MEHLVLAFGIFLISVAWLLILREVVAIWWAAVGTGEVGRERRRIWWLELRLRLLKRIAAVIGRLESQQPRQFD